MKTCPNCKRTYDDETLNFCLVDGSLLSESHDEHKTLTIPATRSTSSTPTEILQTLRIPEGPAFPNPTIESLQHPPIQSAKPQNQSQEKRGHRTGILIGIGVLLGIALGVWITLSLSRSGNRSATNDRTETNVSTATSTDPPKTLPGDQWRACEKNVTQICGVWTRVSGQQWHAKWGGVEANLTITVDGNNVTVARRDVTSTLEAKYRGTLNENNLEITGTVDWCCDRQGRRSGTWRAVNVSAKPNP